MTFRIEKLRRDHRVEGFDCGKEPLNRFLIRFALQSQLSNSSQTYLAFSEDEVVGFYTLVFGDVNYKDAPERLRKGVARHPIPLMILARLAVASAWAGKRIGSGLLKDALARTLAAAEIAGLRAFAVHAKDDEARAFYERFNFIPVAQRSHAPVRAAEGCPGLDQHLRRGLSPFERIDATDRPAQPRALRQFAPAR
jgi:GNAT superfamily N-acetyltransferase